MADETKLLSGGNPQIAKGYGEAPVQAYIAAVPGWKQAAVREVDAIVTRVVPGVQKGVKWNSPMYGLDGKTWFMSLHCMTKYVKVAFFRGQQLDPVPPEASKHAHCRYFHIREGEALDVAQFERWVKQAAALPGDKM